MKSKVKDIVTERLIEKIEAGGHDWLAPFQKGNGVYQNVVSRKPYRGINILMAGLLGGGDTYFATFKQWQELCGLTVGNALNGGENPLREEAKGQGVPIVYFKMMDKTDPSTGDKTGTWPLMRYSTVFGSSQVKELPDKVKKLLDSDEMERQSTNKWVTKQHVEDYIEATDAIINREGDKACYYPARDTIEMPRLSLWSNLEQYYPVLLHELTHWTKHEDRCNRKQSKSWGDKDYAFEELIAELGAAFQCRTLGLHTEPRDDHAAYLASWLKSMKGDSSYIFDAAKLAQQAVDHIESLQPQVEEKAA